MFGDPQPLKMSTQSVTVLTGEALNCVCIRKAANVKMAALSYPPSVWYCIQLDLLPVVTKTCTLLFAW